MREITVAQIMVKSKDNLLPPPNPRPPEKERREKLGDRESGSLIELSPP